MGFPEEIKGLIRKNAIYIAIYICNKWNMHGNTTIFEFWRGKWCLISICIEVPKYIYVPHYDMGVLIIVGNIIMFLRVIISWQGRRSTDGYYPYRCSTWTRVSAGVCECVCVCLGGASDIHISFYLSIFLSEDTDTKRVCFYCRNPRHPVVWYMYYCYTDGYTHM